MRRRYIVISTVVLTVSFLLVFRNIAYAFVSNSERIDRHMLSVMVQGAVSPTKEFTLAGNKGVFILVLPEGAAEVERNTFLIPSSRYQEYLKSLVERDGYTVERFGSSTVVESKGEIVFRISATPYTGAYMKLRYSQ